MVDLHQTEPGLPEGHRWLELSRWGMAWRTALACMLTGMFGVLFTTTTSVGSGISTIEVGFGPIFGFVMPFVLALLALAAGPWLRRYYPFSQGLLFGGMGVAVTFVITVLLSILEALTRSCEPNTVCGDPLGTVSVGLILLGFPTFLQACVGYIIAIWSVTARGARFFWPVLAVVMVVFVTLWTLALAGIFTTAPRDSGPEPRQGPSRTCQMLDDSGELLEVRC